jgi:hypothetical protein
MTLSRPLLRTREAATHVETSTEECNRTCSVYIINYTGSYNHMSV